MHITSTLLSILALAIPTMRSMVFRAPSFGCEDTETGMPDVACLCSSRTFKKMAKSGVRSGCSDLADIASAREWAISRCTAALTAAQFEKREEPEGVSRVPAIALPAAGTTTPSAITSIKKAGKALSHAPIVRPPDGMSVATVSDAAVRGGNPAVTKGYAGALFDLDDDEDETSAALGKQFQVVRLSLAMGILGAFVLF
ncbi:hypothetical protein B0J18DRAFT_452743 [Chaetomium sp. MPI-SDFR-AT-0129]|nr:hypothetical protein B0J18DRAFT_452743 [Chaetomium sp. MPI-SDFR-AT-0129]